MAKGVDVIGLNRGTEKGGGIEEGNVCVYKVCVKNPKSTEVSSTNNNTNNKRQQQQQQY